MIHYTVARKKIRYSDINNMIYSLQPKAIKTKMLHDYIIYQEITTITHLKHFKSITQN